MHDTLVTSEWLAEHLDEPDLAVLDCSVRVNMGDDGFSTNSGRADYDKGHIPGAGFADLFSLCDESSPLDFAISTPEHFATAISAIGVGDDTRVVLYDSGASMWAARVWWMLRWVGFDNAAILDGGFPLWSAEGRPTSTEPVELPARSLTLAPRPEVMADRDEVLAAIDDNATCIIDTLPEAHFRGEFAMYDRAGHIPSAVNVPVFDLLDETGRYRPVDELAALHPGDRNARTITYCGGGIAASGNAFAMHRIGFTDVAVYTASLQEWAADPDAPLATTT